MLSNTSLLTPNGFGTVFVRSKIRNIRRIKKTIFAGTHKAEARNNFAEHVIRSTYIQSDSHHILFASLLIASICSIETSIPP